MTASWISGQEVTPKPRDWSPRDYCVQPSAHVTCLEEGHVFRLGDRDLEVLHIPGESHSHRVLNIHICNNIWPQATPPAPSLSMTRIMGFL